MPLAPIGYTEDGMALTIEQAYRYTIDNGGGTFDTMSLEPVHTGGWAVGAPGGAVIERSSLESVKAFYGAYLALLDKDVAYIGTWLDGGLLYVDPVDLIEDANVAVKLAVERGEKAIYNLDTHVTLTIS